MKAETAPRRGTPEPVGADTTSHRSTDRWWLVGLLAVFAVSRLLYRWAGVRFIYLGFGNGPHVLDVALLQHDLGRSLFYLHAQPPLLNAYFGAVLNSGLDVETTFTVVYLLIGAALAASMFLLMRALRVPAPLAFAVTTVFMVSPATVLYENWVMYTYPVMLFACASGLFFLSYLRTRRTVYAVLFGTSVALLGLTRASYHVVLVFAAVALLVAASGRTSWRRVLAASAIPLLLISGLYIKNWIVFGEPFASSWMGMNMANMVFSHSPPSLKEQAVREGTISRDAVRVPFKPIPFYTDDRPDTGVPALDEIYKSTGGTNLNNREYVEISERYRSEVLSYIAANPVAYPRLVGYGLRIAAVPADDYGILRGNFTPNVLRMRHLYRGLLLQPRDSEMDSTLLFQKTAHRVPEADQIAWGIVLQYLAAFLVAPVLGYAWIRRRPTADPNRRATLVYLSLLVISVFVVSNALELGENQRLRAELDPVVCVIATALVAAAWAWWRQRRSGPAIPPETEPAITSALRG